MNQRAWVSVWIATEIRRWQIEEAARARSVRRAAPPRAPIRRAVGRSIVRIGERVAAEPSFRPARTP
jgi:hypothetical protein